MRAASGASLLVAVALGGYLVATEGGAVATAYVALLAGTSAVVAVRRLAGTPPPPEQVDPLLRLWPRRGSPPPPRPAALLEWEAAMLAARVQGPFDRSLANRLTPLVEACLRVRGIDADDQRAEALVGPVWARLQVDGGWVDDPLDEVDDLARRLATS